MARRVAVIVVLAGLGIALSGCGPCGFDLSWPRSCHGEPAPQR
jgi:hypothetical protein